MRKRIRGIINYLLSILNCFLGALGSSMYDVII